MKNQTRSETLKDQPRNETFGELCDGLDVHVLNDMELIPQVSHEKEIRRKFDSV